MHFRIDHNTYALRLLVALLAILLALSLVACGGGAESTEVDTDEEVPTVKPDEGLVTGMEGMLTIRETGIDSDYALLCERGETLAAVAGLRVTERMYPASMTKLMTFIVAYENISDRTELIEITKEIKNQYADASRLGIDVGDFMSVEQAMYGMLLSSDTDATLGLACHVAGTEKEFVTLMNEKAKEMGLTHTHFANVTGLHDAEHYSTAVEMAAVLSYVLDIPLGRTILTTDVFRTPLKYVKDGVLTDYFMTFYNTTLRDRFELNNVSTTTPGGVQVLGGKTGYTVEADRCLATVAMTVDGREYILITGHASSSENSARDAVKIYDTYAGK